MSPKDRQFKETFQKLFEEYPDTIEEIDVAITNYEVRAECMSGGRSNVSNCIYLIYQTWNLFNVLLTTFDIWFNFWKSHEYNKHLYIYRHVHKYIYFTNKHLKVLVYSIISALIVAFKKEIHDIINYLYLYKLYKCRFMLVTFTK